MPAQSLIRSNIVFGFGAVRSSRTASRASKFEGEISVIATPWLERGIETQPMDAFKGGVRGGGGWPGAKAGAPIGGKRLIWVFGIALSSPQIKNISLY